MRDLREDVTAFLITCDDGTDNYRHCRAALEHQNTQFRIEEIRNVSPMDAAFQQMLDRCETPYFIQVDHDMILKWDAVERLYDGMLAAEREPESAPLAFFCLSLWDQDVARVIVGCKIYNHALCKPIGFRSAYACEMDFNSRLVSAGLRYKAVWPGFSAMDHPSVIGYHGAHYTDVTIFERYKRLLAKARKTGQVGWAYELPAEFLARYMHTKRDLHFFALAGAIAGLTSSDDDEREQDFSNAEVKQEVERMRLCLRNTR